MGSKGNEAGTKREQEVSRLSLGCRIVYLKRRGGRRLRAKRPRLGEGTDGEVSAAVVDVVVVDRELEGRDSLVLGCRRDKQRKGKEGRKKGGTEESALVDGCFSIAHQRAIISRIVLSSLGASSISRQTQSRFARSSPV